MKAFVVCAALLASAVQAEVSSSLVHAALRAKWSSFKAQHSKAYDSSEEHARMATFMDNTRFIEEHNARYHQGLESFEMGHNEMSDLSLEEIKATRMGLVMPPNAAELYANASLHTSPQGLAAPQQMDWRNDNCVQQVKNQGSCGSCYTFSAIGALETAYCRRTGRLFDLSEQHLVDCAGRGCSGGWMHEMFTYLKNNGGATYQQNYKYTGRVGNCRANEVPKVVNVDSHKMIKRGDENDLLNALSTVGSISIAYNAGTQQHAYYRSGILDIKNCGNTPTHAVLLIGYGTDAQTRKDFWILKNSWGTGWGENGYFRLARGENQCGIADWASYPATTSN